MCQVRFQVSRRCGGVQRGKADVRAHGGAKAARWGCVLWMLVLAAASARRLVHQMCTLLYLSCELTVDSEAAK